MTLPPHFRRLSTCHRHPSHPITGFCASCLSERLSSIDRATSVLRRSKSCSCSKRDGSAGVPEPRRNSCDVRAPNTLLDLLLVERSGAGKKLELEIGNLGLELKEGGESEDEIRVSEVVLAAALGNIDQRVLEAEEFDDGVETKTMKELIDLECQSKKHTGRDLKDMAGSFWGAALGFSNKLRKLGENQKLKKERVRGHNLVEVEVAKPSQRRYKETQWEVGDHGLGRRSCDTYPSMSLDAAHYGLDMRSCDTNSRMSLDAALYGLDMRSCDTDPRMSLDAGRFVLGRRSCDTDMRRPLDVGRASCDGVRFSLDDPRVSWDRYVIGRAYPWLAPLISVVEHNNIALAAGGCEEEILDTEKMKLSNEDYFSPQKNPGESAKTRDYYSPQRRRKSFERRDTGREVKELKSDTIGLFHGAKLVITEKELMESNWNQPNVGSHSSNDIGSVPAGDLAQKGFKKLRGWHKVWNIWGSIHKQKQGENEYKAEDKYLGGKVIDKPHAKCLQKPMVTRSYSVSSKSPYSNMDGVVHKMSSIETKGNASKKREELGQQQNQNFPYSPTTIEKQQR